MLFFVEEASSVPGSRLALLPVFVTFFFGKGGSLFYQVTDIFSQGVGSEAKEMVQSWSGFSVWRPYLVTFPF